PEIDVIVGGHTHTFVREPIIANGTPVVQAGCYGAALGELVIRMEGARGKSNRTCCTRLMTRFRAIPASPRRLRPSKARHRPFVSRGAALRRTSRWRRSIATGRTASST